MRVAGAESATGAALIALYPLHLGAMAIDAIPREFRPFEWGHTPFVSLSEWPDERDLLTALAAMVPNMPEATRYRFAKITHWRIETEKQSKDGCIWTPTRACSCTIEPWTWAVVDA